MWIDVDQRSTDWLHHRCGSVTSCHLCDVMAKLKRQPKEGPQKEAAARLNYKRAKVRENLTGLSLETYVSPYMEKGMDIEPLARAAYENETGRDVDPGGLYVHDVIPRWMASPDGRIGDDGLLEIKYLSGVSAATDTNHIDLLRGKKPDGTPADIPEEYILQMAGQLSCSGRQWVDFVSFDPEMPEGLQLFIKRYRRDETLIAQIEDEVQTFLEEVVAILKDLEAVHA